MLSGRRGNVEMTSSGAFFDPKAVSGPLAKKGSLGAQDPSSQSDIIAQLTREMKLSGIGREKSLSFILPPFLLSCPTVMHWHSISILFPVKIPCTTVIPTLHHNNSNLAPINSCGA